MLIEIHMIQNHSYANMNRDDLGAPKSAFFGGTIRSRISSQCIKRSIRRSKIFENNLEAKNGIRTKALVYKIASAVSSPEKPSAKLLDDIKAAMKKGGIKFVGNKPKKDSENQNNLEDNYKSKILIFVSTSALEELVNITKETWSPDSKSYEKALSAKYHEILTDSALAPDIALSGRMMELEKGGIFKNINFSVEASLSTSHAFSTHECKVESDYFTCVDDLTGENSEEKGAGHVSEALFSSACFYKYFAIDYNQLVKNLAGNTDLASQTVESFIKAAALTSPSGKQHSSAAFNLPSGILVEIKENQKIMTNYANAYADAIPQNSNTNIIEESILRLGQHAWETSSGYNIDSERYWFSPAGKYQLTYREYVGSDTTKDKPLLENENQFIDLNHLLEATTHSVQQYVHKSNSGE